MCSLLVLICSVAACCFSERMTTPSRTATTACFLGWQLLSLLLFGGQGAGRMSWPWCPKPAAHCPTWKLRASQKLSRYG